MGQCQLDIDLRRVSWRRVLDMNDRALRDIVCGLGGPGNGFPRQSGFDITVASEVMAIFCLAKDLSDLTQRLGSIIVGWTRAHKPVYARDLKAPGAMAVLLKMRFVRISFKRWSTRRLSCTAGLSPISPTAAIRCWQLRAA